MRSHILKGTAVCICNMATVDVYSSAFRPFDRSSCASNSSNSFSIRNILNKPDTEAEQCGGYQLNDVLPCQGPFPCLYFPFIPRVLWPVVQCDNNDSVPYTTGLINQQEFRFKPQYHVWGCSSAVKEIPLKGEYRNNSLKLRVTVW